MNKSNLEPLGRLNSIDAPIGTVLAINRRTMDFVAVCERDDRGVVVRRATPEEMTAMPYGEPNSVAEHHAIPRVPSPYGMVRKIRYPSPVPHDD